MTDFPISQATDLIAVLGTCSNDDGSASVAQIRRCQKAFELWQANPAACILVMGGAVANQIVEAQTMAAWLRARGVPGLQVLEEGQTQNTRSQARLLSGLFSQSRPRSLTVVSDGPHLIRTKMLLIHAGMKPKSFGLAGAPVAAPFPEHVRMFVYETVNYVKDFVRTSLGVW